MTILVYAAVAVSVLIFVAATVTRTVLYARSPIHLRWELYPVPHERPDRAAHGGSYFEESEWWRCPRRRRLRGELAVMVPEILFLDALRKFNRALWYRSFPFHFGLYLGAGAGFGLLVTAAVGRLAGTAWLAGPVERLLTGVVAVAGWSGLSLAVLGAVALLHRRLTDAALRAYTTAGDVCNLLFYAAALGVLGAGYVLRPAGSPDAWSLAAGLLSWDTSVEVPPLLATGIVTTSALLAYIPLTHMSHFIGKYFTYHAVRWDDAPMSEGGRVSAAMAEYLTFRPTWAAGHIRSDGTPTWTEVADRNPAREARR